MIKNITDDLKKFIPREEQKKALSYIDDVYTRNKSKKFFLLNLPVGVGKSHLAIMISNYFIKKNKSYKVDIITAGKLLQDQYMDTYESLCNLKGKDNYTCNDYLTTCEKGNKLASISNQDCQSCPYIQAFTSYTVGDISLTNFHLFLINSISHENKARKANILIIDECHELDDVISDFVTIRMSEAFIKKFKLPNEKEVLDKLSTICDIDEYNLFVAYLISIMKETKEEIEKYLGPASDKKTQVLVRKTNAIKGSKSKDIELLELYSEIENTLGKMNTFLEDYKINPNNWVFDNIYDEKNNSKTLTLEPIWAQTYLQKYVWSKYDLVFLMSGTILNKKIFSDINGIPLEDAVFFSIPSPFKKENRKIYYLPTGKMTFKEKQYSFKKQVEYINKLLNKYKDSKGIIHTNSFELSEWIRRDINNDRLLIHNKDNREEILLEHKKQPFNSVLVSPSISTGVSFDGDMSRFQIISKIPYPNLSSKKNIKRNETKSGWYNYNTICKLIQMTGRSVRSMDDYADTFILDSSFGDILIRRPEYIPEWFRDAITFVKLNK